MYVRGTVLEPKVGYVRGNMIVGGPCVLLPRKFVYLVKKVPFEQDKIATPLLEYEKKPIPNRFFHEKKNFSPLLNFPILPSC